MTMRAAITDEQIEWLVTVFRRNGYVRRQNVKRLEADGQAYKKGEEVRLVADSREELTRIRCVLRLAGFKPGWPFPKAKQFRQPLYGKAEVARFLDWVDENERRLKRRPAAKKKSRSRKQP